ncbi:uncharacterized protein LOC131008284 [Salvia miltiorrhiza]|uniref:uncharacterized protein LOC131008284 n=1 Tax=Salvia miltiorrhiza TaxID=226208 RepID=UPI0025AB62EA|nr:uncharacterized protein LOC131008284 [Salvia miltiorrhiza]
MEHALRDCPWVTFMWEISPIRLRPMNATTVWNIEEWFEQVRLNPSKEVHSAFATIAWASWYARNLLLFQNKRLTHIECLMVAQGASWKRPTCFSLISSKPRSVSCVRETQVKIKCDAAIGEGVGMGFAAVMLDAEDVLLGVRWGFIQGVFTAEEGEARAILEGCIFCEEKGCRDVILETDCQTLYWRLLKREEDLSFIGDTLKDIFSRADSMHQVKWSWTPRENSVEADRLAKYALVSRSVFSSSVLFPFVSNSTAF